MSSEALPRDAARDGDHLFEIFPGNLGLPGNNVDGGEPFERNQVTIGRAKTEL